MKRRTLIKFGVPVMVMVALVVYGIAGRERAIGALARVANAEEIGRAHV